MRFVQAWMLAGQLTKYKGQSRVGAGQVWKDSDIVFYENIK